MNVVVVGYGSIGKRRVHILQELGCIVSVLETDMKKALTVLEDGLTWFVSAGPPDAVVICTPPDSHVKIAADFVSVRDCRAIFIEKPLSHNQCGLDRLEDAVAKRNAITMVACNLRFHAAVAALHERVAARYLGKRLAFHASFGQHLVEWRPGQDYRETYSAHEAQGGGIILDAIHEIDLAIWFMGPVIEVKALSGHTGVLDTDTEDLAVIILRHECGALSTLQLDCLQRTYCRSIRVVGTDDADGFHYGPGLAMYHDEMRHFLACVKNREQPMNGLAEARHTLAVALLAKKGGGVPPKRE